MPAKKINTITLGCRLNFYESEVLKSSLSEEFSEGDEVIIINTCCVTHEAERQSKQAVRKCLREHPEAKVIVSGCAVHTEREYFSELKGVHKIIDNDMKRDYESADTFSGKNESLFDGKARGFLQIQNGCDNYCTFCIVPFTRGKPRSLPLKIIHNHIENLLDSGLSEIVFSGVDITSYGKDLEEKIELADVLISVLEKFPVLERIRISSLDPHGITAKLTELIMEEQRILPHLHLSIQSGDDHILRLMRRRHTRAEVIKLCNTIKEKREDIVFGSDFIAGFPGESEEMFENTISIVDEAGISFLHVFPYSVRAGTIAASFIQLPREIIRSRAGRLRMKGKVVYKLLLNSFVGKTDNFIVEKESDGIIHGKTDHFISIRAKNTGGAKEGDVVKHSLIEFVDGNELVGRVG
ncbi:MAG: tRNA (N(6)-L-threonylcarbamoyladenosine(37)-C(2))-methylthiotransferase MtaB [Holosporales bacterium]|jgi:threonylcarbamoyladenosine tRNA methylthiotransferase MtaB|nr:tRNA (N(6)-L-threonylcarbamoyladenosine(37)-C(2))-methylthiotransferase MtaB [Holosporales bacterium]